MTPTAPERRRTSTVLAVALGVAGVALLALGAWVLQDAQSRYDAELAHDCTGMTCANLGPLNGQPEYVGGLALIGVGLVVVIAAFAAYAGVLRRRRARG